MDRAIYLIYILIDEVYYMINRIKKLLNEIDNDNYYSVLINENEFKSMQGKKIFSYLKHISYHQASEALSYYNTLNKNKKNEIIKDFEEYLNDIRYDKSIEIFKGYIINNYVVRKTLT